MRLWLWDRLFEDLLEVMALQWVLPVIGDEVIEAVKQFVFDEIVLD